MGLMMATSAYVGFMNDDDKYDPTYLEVLYTRAQEEGADLVACNFYERKRRGNLFRIEPRVNHITAGCFLARTGLAQYVGYNSREYAADGYVIEDLMKAGAKFVHVPTPLYTHW